MTLTLTKTLMYIPMSSQVSFASTDNIHSVLISILVVQSTQPNVDVVLLFADGEYMSLSGSGICCERGITCRTLSLSTFLCSYFYLRQLDDG